jgi:hypothetical protein
MWAHALIDKLANIVNYCDLLKKEVEVSPKSLQRVATIQEIARGVIEEAIEHQRALAEQNSADLGGDKVA